MSIEHELIDQFEDTPLMRRQGGGSDLPELARAVVAKLRALDGCSGHRVNGVNSKPMRVSSRLSHPPFCISQVEIERRMFEH